jgi:monoamine oxidase
MARIFDVVVIGAGMAGLTAARRVAEQGKSTLVLEASSRVGGRTWTVNGATGAIELGAEFVHGEPEPTLALAREAGIALTPIPTRHFAKFGAAFQALRDPWQPFEAVLKRLQPDEPDMTALDFAAKHAIDPETIERFRQLVEGFEAAPFAEVSIRSLATDADSVATDDAQFRVEGGYGRLVDFQQQRALAAGVELRLQARAQRLRWQMSGPVSIGLGQTQPELSAKACIVAVPLAILQAGASAGGLQIEPPISSWRKPLERLAMGYAYRFTFELPQSFAANATPRAAFIHQPTSLFEAAWSQETANGVAWTVWSGGPKARSLAHETEIQRQKLALGALATLLEMPEASVLEALLAGPHSHDFCNDDLVRGGYSFCRPGGAKDSESLSAPIGDALFLAGEASDHEYPGTVAGAIQSGERAARQVLAALAR